MRELRIVLLGLSITSSWGNGHATNYRGLVRALTGRGHDVLFLERDMPWYAAERDLPEPPWGRLELYGSVEELRERFSEALRDADLVVVGSYVPDGVAVAEHALDSARGPVAFYDLDTPVTLAALARNRCEYLTPELAGRFDLYLSFTGGPTLGRLEREFGVRRARAFHCFVDPEAYRPLEADAAERWAAGYLGTYGADRQPALERLLLEPARSRPDLRFAVAGPQYPEAVDWPANVERIAHLAPPEHPAFYAAQRFTVNVTRADMRRAGWSPSVRLFEAAACGVPVVSDAWEGLDTFFAPGREILVEETLERLEALSAEDARAIGERARARVLAQHTAEHRADELEAHVGSLAGARA
ncbi:MAG TPA: glycosyltransferase [Gaiellaceae bacterium]|nr:glycosyltransferase [Gaiellaceae bacterium]